MHGERICRGDAGCPEKGCTANGMDISRTADVPCADGNDAEAVLPADALLCTMIVGVGLGHELWVIQVPHPYPFQCPGPEKSARWHDRIAPSIVVKSVGHPFLRSIPLMRDCGRQPSIIFENKAINDVKPIYLKSAPLKKPSGK